MEKDIKLLNQEEKNELILKKVEQLFGFIITPDVVTKVNENGEFEFAPKSTTRLMEEKSSLYRGLEDMLDNGFLDYNVALEMKNAIHFAYDKMIRNVSGLYDKEIFKTEHGVRR